MVIFLVRSQQVAKMPLAEDNDMVKTIPSDRTDEPLRMSVLPWRSWCDRPVPNAHRANATDKDIAIDTIPIANDILRRLLPAVCLGELTRNPLGARMRGHAQLQNLAAGMPQDQKSIQQPERDRGDHEQIHRRELCMPADRACADGHATCPPNGYLGVSKLQTCNRNSPQEKLS